MSLIDINLGVQVTIYCFISLFGSFSGSHLLHKFTLCILLWGFVFIFWEYYLSLLLWELSISDQSERSFKRKLFLMLTVFTNILLYKNTLIFQTFIIIETQSRSALDKDSLKGCSFNLLNFLYFFCYIYSLLGLWTALFPSTLCICFPCQFLLFIPHFFFKEVV